MESVEISNDRSCADDRIIVADTMTLSDHAKSLSAISVIFIAFLYISSLIPLSNHSISKKSQVQTYLIENQLSIAYSISDIRPFNHQISLSAHFSYFGPKSSIRIQAVSEVSAKRGRTAVHHFFQNVTSTMLSISKYSHNSESLFLFADRCIDYTSVEASVILTGDLGNVEEATLEWKVGNPKHTIFVLWFRFISALFISYFAIPILIEIHKHGLSSASFIQRLTLILSLLSICSSNPLIAVQFSYPSRVIVTIQSIIDLLFAMFIRLYAFFLFFSLSGSSLTDDPRVLAISSTTILVSFCQKIFREFPVGQATDMVHISQENQIQLLDILSVAVVVGSFLLSLATLIEGMQSRLLAYLISCGVYALLIIFFDIFISRDARFKETAFSSIFKQIAATVFTCTMERIHQDNRINEYKEVLDAGAEEALPDEEEISSGQ